MSCILFVISCSSPKLRKENKDITKLDSISQLISEGSNTSYSNVKRTSLLLKAYNLNIKLEHDSANRSHVIKLMDASYLLKDLRLFRKFASLALKNSVNAFDTINLARTHHYLALDYLSIEKKDSAYYHFNKAASFYIFLKNMNHVGNMYYGMASVQSDVKDYTGSDILAFKAIKYFKDMDNKNGLYDCYNLLGINSANLDEHEMALNYYIQANDLIDNIDEYRTSLNFNNIGNVYQHMGLYKESINYYRKALSAIGNKNEHIDQYARVITNLNYSRLLQEDTLNVFKNFIEALNIRDSIGNKSNVIGSKLRISEYLAFKGDTLEAIKFCKEAYNHAMTISENNDRLVSLKLLTVLDPLNSSFYYEKYTLLNDSLQKEERRLRNKFTRIRFETDEHIEKAEKLSQQKVTILLVSAVMVVILGLMYYIRVQRSRNKELLFDREQQKANEEIYDLMLKQQTVMEEGRKKERDRIAEELHDGIIGDVFGTRISFESLKLKGSNEDEEEFQDLIMELQRIEKEVRNLSHDLKKDWFNSENNFVSLVSVLVEKQGALGKWKYDLSIDDNIDWSEIEGTVKINIYRILQEALLNCYKYASATRVKINFTKKKNTLILVIQDDGCGFEYKKGVGGIGIINLKSRVGKMNGSFELESAINKGTLIKVILPYGIE